MSKSYNFDIIEALHWLELISFSKILCRRLLNSMLFVSVSDETVWIEVKLLHAIRSLEHLLSILCLASMAFMHEAHPLATNLAGIR